MPENQHRENGDPTRRLRYDDLTALAARRASSAGRRRISAMTGMSALGHSGRRFVMAAGLVLVVLWAVLYVIFIDWRANYRARAAYGASRVTAALRPLETIVPPGVQPDAWRDAVARTRAMLISVTGSNLLDKKEMARLIAELDQFVARARARPETALRELADMWDLVAERAEFLFRDSRSADGTRHRRPELLPPARAKPRALSDAPRP
jgi:hypothetical protein